MNLLQASFDQTDQSGFRVIYRVPPLRLADGKPPLVLDFGDATGTWESDKSGTVVHTYEPGDGLPRVVTPTLGDADGNIVGRFRFELPRTQSRPFNIAATAF